MECNYKYSAGQGKRGQIQSICTTTKQLANLWRLGGRLHIYISLDISTLQCQYYKNFVSNDIMMIISTSLPIYSTLFVLSTQRRLCDYVLSYD